MLYFIVGPRRSGKTTMITKLKEEGCSVLPEGGGILRASRPHTREVFEAEFEAELLKLELELLSRDDEVLFIDGGIIQDIFWLQYRREDSAEWNEALGRYFRVLKEIQQEKRIAMIFCSSSEAFSLEEEKFLSCARLISIELGIPFFHLYLSKKI